MEKNQDGVVSTARDGKTLIIEVDRQEKMNGFTPEMFEGVSKAFEELEQDPELWVGVFIFAGKHTTAGLDLPKFFGPAAEQNNQQKESDRPDAFALKRRCTKPIVAAVQGVTYTVGIEMLLATDIVVAAEDCRFCQLEPKRGLAVFGGAHVRYVQRAGWGNAMYHLLRADEFDAVRAKELGFVQEVVAAGSQVERAKAIAKEICLCAPLAVQEIKRAAQLYLDSGEEVAFAEIDKMRSLTLSTEDAKEGMQSFIEKRDPQFKGR